MSKRYLDNSVIAEKILISSGKMLNTRGVHIFGAVPVMSNNATGTVWDVNDTVYPWSIFSTPGVVNIPAVNASDNGDIIVVQGLDANFNEQEEILIASSSGTVTGSLIFSRVFGAIDVSDTNTANIDIRKNSTVVARITAGLAQAAMAVYTIPNGYTGYFTQGVCTCQVGGDATVNVRARFANQSSFRTGHSFEVSGAGGQYFYQLTTPLRLPARTDLDVVATVRTNNSRIAAAYDIILVRD